MNKYVVGFVFNSNMENVLLIHKNRPEWQKGLINGLGGKIEEGEDSISALIREIKEESGLDTTKDQWIYSGRIYSDTFYVDFFGCVYEGNMEGVNSTTDEPIEWFPVSNLPSNTVENLPWLVHLTLDKMKNDNFYSFEVKYKK